LSQAFSSWYFP